MRSNPQRRSGFNSKSVTLIVFGFVFAVIPAINIRNVLAQGFSVTSNSPPSVVGSSTFVSLAGKFSIALPKDRHGLRPLAVDTQSGRATGDAYTWTMQEGAFTVGYVEAARPLDDPEATKAQFTGLRDHLTEWALAQNGKLLSATRIDFEQHPALELRIELPDALLVQRVYLVSRRFYQAVLYLKGEQRSHEVLALKALDSFKLLSDADVTAALEAKAAEAEPSPLPQEPFVARVRSDAADDGLRGRVKTVFQESEDLTGTWAVQGRKPSSIGYYNERGNLTRRESYDYMGNLSDITVFGYIDGARVSSWKRIEHEYNPPPMMVVSPPGVVRPKSDPRYSNRFTFQYDDEKRLIEKTWYMSNGEVSIRYVYKYSGHPANQLEEWAYTSDGSLNQRYISVLDDKGNEVERTSFETRDGSVRYKNSYAYEFDGEGNWIKRTASKWVTKDGKSYYVPASVDYRTITYYKPSR